MAPRDAPLPTGPPPPRAIPAGGPSAIPPKDREGVLVPTNQLMFDVWKSGKQPPPPPPPHMVLDWTAFGPASTDDASGAGSTDEANTAYLDAHGVSEALRAAIGKIVNASPRPADPIAALGRLLSAEAAKEPDAAAKELTDAVGAIDLGE